MNMTKENPGQNKNRSYAPQTFLKAMEILSCFTFRQPELTSAQISKMLDIAPSTLYRYLSTLEQEQYIMRVENTNRYAVGLRIVELSSVALCRYNIRLHGEPVLRSLSATLNMSGNIGVLHRGSVLHVAFAMVDEVDKLYSIVGRCAELTCTAMGKILLAALPEEEMERTVGEVGFARHTSRSITTMEALKAELDTVRTKGYAVDQEEKVHGRKCLAMPVYQQGGQVVAAMSISTGELDRFRQEFDEIRHILREHAGLLSARLGFYR